MQQRRSDIRKRLHTRWCTLRRPLKHAFIETGTEDASRLFVFCFQKSKGFASTKHGLYCQIDWSFQPQWLPVKIPSPGHPRIPNVLIHGDEVDEVESQAGLSILNQTGNMQTHDWQQVLIEAYNFPNNSGNYGNPQEPNCFTLTIFGCDVCPLQPLRL